jgi:hypothetical protein
MYTIQAVAGLERQRQRQRQRRKRKRLERVVVRLVSSI